MIAFTDPSDLDPMLLIATVHYLGATKGSERVYTLLAGALLRSGHVAVAKVALRNRETIVVVGVTADGGMLMQQLRWADEIREAPAVPQAMVSRAEEGLADTLVAAMAVDSIDMADFEDDYQAAINELVTKKLRGQLDPCKAEISAPKAAPDLTAALKAEESMSPAAKVAQAIAQRQQYKGSYRVAAANAR